MLILIIKWSLYCIMSLFFKFHSLAVHFIVVYKTMDLQWIDIKGEKNWSLTTDSLRSTVLEDHLNILTGLLIEIPVLFFFNVFTNMFTKRYLLSQKWPGVPG